MSTIKPEYIAKLQEWLQIEKSPKRDGFRFRIHTEIQKKIISGCGFHGYYWMGYPDKKRPLFYTIN